MQISRSEQMVVSRTMSEYGGSFVKALGYAISLADEDNLQRIKDAFPELWEGYLDYACTCRLVANGHGAPSAMEEAPAGAGAL